MGSDGIPDGMIELWTIETETAPGELFIDDLVETKEEAAKILETRGSNWSTQKIVVPYRKPAITEGRE
jgi:hypothetical protein